MGQTPMAFGGWLVEDDCGAGSILFIEFKIALVGGEPWQGQTPMAFDGKTPMAFDGKMVGGII